MEREGLWPARRSMPLLSRRRFLGYAGGVSGAMLLSNVASGLGGAVAGASTVPNLVVTALHVPGHVVSGQSVTLRATVRNLGSTATSPDEGVGVTFRLEGSGSTWSGSSRKVLRPGESTVIRATTGSGGDRAWRATAGAHTVLATPFILRGRHHLRAGRGKRAVLAVTVATGTAAPVGISPTSTAAPTIAGDPVVGECLTVSEGAWTGEPTSYTYQWRRSGTAVDDATEPAYTLTVTDLGQSMSCTVTAANAAGSTAVASLPTAEITAPQSLPSASSTSVESIVPLGSGAVFVGNPHLAQGCTSFSATAKADQPFTLDILTSQDGRTNVTAASAAATLDGTSYLAALAVEAATVDAYTAVRVTSGPQSMTVFSVSSDLA